jgi:hypothetical protein
MKTVTVVKRAAAPALAAGILVTAFATPAAAQPPGSTVVRSGTGVSLSARYAVSNYVTFSDDGGDLIVEDQSGIYAGPGCEQLTPTAAVCGETASATRLTVALRDWSDVLHVGVAVNTTVDAGTGTDSITTGGGDDTIFARDGVRGNDWITCDGHRTRDTAYADLGDSINPDCELRYRA